MIQRMFVTLDTKKTNYKNVGKINHGDDLILELTVLSDGDMISFNDPMVDLLVKKSDGKMIRQNSGIEHIKPNKFVIEVGKDCVTSPGLSTNQLIINDNGRISTCMFYYTILNSLEEDIIQSISSVEVLEQLDEYVIEARERMELLNNDINELEEFFGATSDTLVEAEMARNEAEQNRIHSEILRVNNENDRIEADNIRNQNESIRNQNEVDRSSSELVREQRESERILNEEERRQNESERMIDESTRQQNENIRQSNESIRISNETDRKTQENRRATAETNRVNAETVRRNNENSRISNESERQKAMNEMKSLLEDARGFDDRVDVIEDEIEEINSSLDNITKLIIPHEEWEIELINSLKSNTSIKLVGDFETDTLFNFNNIHNARLEVKGTIKLNRSIIDFDQLFIFEDCSDLELVLNIDCNKSETRSAEYYPVIQFISCKNVVVTNSKLENIPHTGIGIVNSQNCIVKDSNFINFYDSGLNVGEGSINCIIKNNNFTCPDGLMNYGSHALNIYSRGINTYGHLISGNNFYDIQSTAIQLTGRIDSDGNVRMDVTDCIIENNMINYFGHNGVKLDGTGKNISINNNIFKNANARPDGTKLNHDCYGIFTSGQSGRAYSVDSIGNYFENCGNYSLRFSADIGDVMGYINFKNNNCINSPIYIAPNSKVDTVDIIGNRIIQGSILLTNGLSESTIGNVNISYNVFKNYDQNGYCIYFINNGCLRFNNNTIETLYASKNPGYIGYLSSTNMVVENNNIINIGGSDNKIRTVSGIIETCVFNGNINMDLYNQNDINTSYIKDYTKII